MSLGGRKPKKGSLGTSFIIEKIPGLKRLSCSNCINYNMDKSCDAKHVLMSEIGYDYWRQCDQFELNDKFATEENIALAERTRKRVEKTHKIDKNNKSKKRKNKGKSVEIIKINHKKVTPKRGKRVISRLTVQERKKKGESYQKIAEHFGVDRELIRKIDLGFYGSGYMEAEIK